jgi:hypothetical protein
MTGLVVEGLAVANSGVEGFVEVGYIVVRKKVDKELVRVVDAGRLVEPVFEDRCKVVKELAHLVGQDDKELVIVVVEGFGIVMLESWRIGKCRVVKDDRLVSLMVAVHLVGVSF